MKRRSFLKTSLAAGAALAVPARAEPQLPWEREVSLREAARSTTLESVLDPANPQPDFGGNPFPGPSMAVNNLKIRSTVWGPPHRITFSFNRNNVWDRRLHEFPVPTLKDITDGAFAPANKDYVGIAGNSLRPRDLGWLSRDGGAVDPYRNPMRYAFPSLKPVGQFILGLDSLTGAAAPKLSQDCSNGIVTLNAARGAASAQLQYVLGMTSNVLALTAVLDGMDAPVWLRLYRHNDTSHLTYMTPDGQYTNPAAEADKAFNGPITPPTAGQRGHHFWIRQKFPAEKTFPDGFEYLLMGLAPGFSRIETVEGRKGMGTPPPNQPLNREWKGAARPAIADAPGAAATSVFPAGTERLEAFFTIVTSMDGDDLEGIAIRRLDSAHGVGFEGLMRENTQWWNEFYDRREDGRVFRRASGSDCSDDVRAIYRSYSDFHGGGTKTDMRQFEGSASYALPERDFQEWDSAPCYNEIFTTSRFVRNWGDSEEMWKQIVGHWIAGAEDNARTMFGLPGMLISHGYLPPVKPDKYVHTTITLELCLGTMAQIIRPAWDEWDYGGDIEFLRNECYPLMRRMALFYAAYARKGDDGHYHVIPSMQEESWGIYPGFSRNKDVISSMCLFRWGLTRAAEAAELLGVDAELRAQWREVAAGLAPYPTWQRPDGLVFAEMPGLEPVRLPGDHFGDAASYPALLADEINLDSPPEQRQMMSRGVRLLPSGSTIPTLLLLGEAPDETPAGKRYSDDAELLLNSRGGRIHLFPVNLAEKTLAFRNFQARGGFLVSACRNEAGVYHAEIAARRSLECRVMNPWPGEAAVIRSGGSEVPARLDTTNGECLVFPAVAGRSYTVEKKSA